ncbi:DUF4136 domain-containing protein [Marinihelvus fidelis]|uniref:DUF4136 domain-containing protein n=1 Tax=Marinihelvus fidelis TaxID=2613842 RepID=A0A5N0T639_9GAMM|nr:DUF4136 domain-containing protein [Marinihelvus fidelis]KAA9130530.1 DUF4136 domain-containing protein [Marinihelvus fidelis]
MTKLIKVMLPIAACAWMTACTSTSRIQSDYQDELQISQHKTYGFKSRAEFRDADLVSELELYVSAAVVQELRAAGLVESDNPDILIDVSAELEEVTRAPMADGVGNGICPSYEDYFSRWYNFSYGGTTGESRSPVCKYADGQFSVELLDAKQDQSIMKGVSLVRLDENDRGERLLLSASYDVATMFGDSPERDGRLTRSMANR